MHPEPTRLNCLTAVLKRPDYWLKAPRILETRRAIHDFPFWCFIRFPYMRKGGCNVHYLRTLSCRLCFRIRADMIMQFVRSPPPFCFHVRSASRPRALVPSSVSPLRRRSYFRRFLYKNLPVPRNFRGTLTFVTADNLHAVINGNPSNHWEYQRRFLSSELKETLQMTRFSLLFHANQAGKMKVI